MKEFFYWQGDAYDYMLPRDHSALFMEMRLGKTLVALRHMTTVCSTASRRLWVTSISSFRDWKIEAEGEGISYLDIQGQPKARRQAMVVEAFDSAKPPVILANHELLRAEPVLADLPWEYVCIDESARIKNPDAKLTKLCCAGFRQAHYRTILSGRPAPESPLEYFSQFQFLDGRFLGHRNYWHFRGDYFEPDPWDKYSWIPKPGTRELIATALEQKAFVKLRKDIRSNEKMYDQRIVQPTKQQVDLQKQVAKELAYEYNGEYFETNYAVVKTTWLRRIAGGFDPHGEVPISHTKLDALVDMLRYDFAGQKVVVWCHFQEESKVIAEFLSHRGWTVATSNGSISPERRAHARHSFCDGHTQVFVATIASEKTGANLSVADVAIYYSNDWSADGREQSEDRVVSMNKQNPVLIIDLITEGSIDEEAVVALREKRLDSLVVLTNWLARWAA